MRSPAADRSCRPKLIAFAWIPVGEFANAIIRAPRLRCSVASINPEAALEHWRGHRGLPNEDANAVFPQRPHSRHSALVELVIKTLEDFSPVNGTYDCCTYIKDENEPEYCSEHAKETQTEQEVKSEFLEAVYLNSLEHLQP